MGQKNFKKIYALLNNEYFYVSILFLLIVFAFLHRIFLGEVYSPINMYYHFLPWSSEMSREGTRGSLLSDPIGAMYPVMNAFRESLLSQELALWFPYGGFGFPGMLDTVAHILVPTRWIFLIFPITIAPTIHIFVRLFLTLLGMYVLLRSFNMKQIPSIIGAIIFCFSMPMIVWMFWPHIEVSMFAPWLMWSSYMIFLGKRRFIVLTAFLVHWMLVLHMPAYAIYFYYLISFFFIFLLICEYIKSKNISGVLKKGLDYSLSLVLGILLSLPYILPFLEMASYTGYQESRMGVRFRSSFWNMNNILLSFDPGYNKVVPFSTHMNELANYFGVVSILLSILSVFLILYKRKNMYYFFVATAIILFGLLYNLPVFRYVAALPLISSSGIHRLIVVFVFVCSILVAKCIDILTEDIPKKIIAIGSIFSTIGLGVLFLGAAHSQSGFVWSSGLSISLITCIIVLSLIYLVISESLTKRNFALILILIFVFDLFRGSISYTPSVIFEKSDPAVETEVTTFLSDRVENSRILTMERWILISNNSAFYGLHNLRSHSQVNPEPRINLFLRGIYENAYQVSPTRTQFNRIDNHYLLNLTSVRYLLKPHGNSDDSDDSFMRALNVPDKAPLGELVAGYEFSQTFVARESYLAGITFGFATYTRTFEEGTLQYILSDEQGTVLSDGIVYKSDLRNNRPYTIFFEPIIDSVDKKYTLTLYSKDCVPGNAATLWVLNNGYNDHPDEIAIWNGTQLPGNAIFELVYTFDGAAEMIQASGLDVIESTNAVPRAYLTDKVLMAEPSVELLDTMVSFSDTSIAFVESDREIILSGEKGLQPVDILEYKPDRIVINSSSQSDAWLVLTDLYYPGWNVYIDGARDSISRTNYLFRGVFVPAGERTIEFVYRPWSFYSGIIVYVAVLVCMALYSLFRYVKRAERQN